MKDIDMPLVVLKGTAFKLQKKVEGEKISKRDQVLLLFFSRAILDIESAQLLVSKGYIGSAKTLLAVFHRNLMMFASLIDADETRVNKFFDENENSYDTNEDKFASEFSDREARKIAQKRFGEDAFHKAEFEKCLHGSCHAIRKFYTDRVVRDGKRIPVLRLEAFHHEEFKKIAILLINGYILDFLGVFYTKYQGDQNYKKEELVYMDLVRKAKAGLL